MKFQCLHFIVTGLRETAHLFNANQILSFYSLKQLEEADSILRNSEEKGIY